MHSYILIYVPPKLQNKSEALMCNFQGALKIREWTVTVEFAVVDNAGREVD